MTDSEQPTLAQVAYDAYSAMVMQIEAYVAELYARRTHT